LTSANCQIGPQNLEVVSSDLRGDLVAALAGFYAGHPDAERYPMLSEVSP